MQVVICQHPRRKQAAVRSLVRAVPQALPRRAILPSLNASATANYTKRPPVTHLSAPPSPAPPVVHARDGPATGRRTPAKREATVFVESSTFTMQLCSWTAVGHEPVPDTCSRVFFAPLRCGPRRCPNPVPAIVLALDPCCRCRRGSNRRRGHLRCDKREPVQAMSAMRRYDFMGTLTMLIFDQKQFDGRTSRVMAHFFERVCRFVSSPKVPRQDEHAFCSRAFVALTAPMTGVNACCNSRKRFRVFVGGRSVVLISSYCTHRAVGTWPRRGGASRPLLVRPRA